MRPSAAITTVCGIEFRPFMIVRAVSGSAQPKRKPNLKSRANCRTLLAEVRGSSVVRPMNSTARPSYSLRTFSYSGTSMRHGPHHVAQRFTTITLPAKSDRLKLPLSTDLSWRVSRLLGNAPNAAAVAGALSVRTVIGGSDGVSGRGGGGGVMPLLPD